MVKELKIRLSVVAVSLVVILCLASLSTIGAGEIGVVTTFGSLNEKTLDSGAHFLNPFSNVSKINLRTLTSTTSSQAASKDLQTVHTDITLNYSLDPKGAIEFYKNIGNHEYLESSIIKPAISETFKSVVALFSAEDLINKREIVSEKIEKTFKEKISKFGVIIDSISITNFEFSKSFNEAIESKVTAQQKVLTAENDLQRISIEAKQKIVRAEAEAKSLSLQKGAITPELILLRQTENQADAIKKWNGVLPNYTGGNIPFIMNEKK